MKAYAKSLIWAICRAKQPKWSVSVLTSGAVRRACLGLLICLWLIMTVALTGCKVDQQKEIAVYTKVLHGEGEKPPAPLEPNQPLTLLDALKQAAWHNEQLAIKGEAYLQALIDKDRSVAAFIPTISYTPIYTRQQKISSSSSSSVPIQSFVPPSAFDQPVNAGINLNVPGNIANVKRAASEADRQKELLLNLKSTVLLDVANIYYQVLILESRLGFLEYSISVQHHTIKDAASKYTAGVITPADFALAQSQLSQTNVSLSKARNDVANARAELALLIGVADVNGPLSDELELPEKLPDEQQLLTAAEQYRNDLKASKYQLEESVHLLQQAWSQYFPSVSLNFTYFLSRQSFPSQVRWINTLEFNLPIFSAGLIHDDVRQAWSLLRQAHYAHSYLLRQVDKELKVALENYRDTEKQVEDFDVVTVAARKDLHRTDSAYKAGTATSLELMQAQDRLKNAQFELTSARLTEKVYYLSLMRVLGRFNENSLAEGFTPTATNEQDQPYSTSSPLLSGGTEKKNN
jgi:outer membrane protein TolC